jgi:ribonuclease D
MHDDDGTEVPVVIPLDEPADGVPEVVTTPESLASAVAALGAGSGPVAVDAERASGYRYGQRTYLVQLRRAGSGTWLIDPAALPDLTTVSEALRGVEWVLHAASQDLPSLVEQHMVPDEVFDTELAARLLGMPRVGLAAVVADTLGLGLAKEHSAVDWSIRPLHPDWLRYAALDVEVLVEVRDVLADRLTASGKSEWARQEFEAVRTAPPAPPKVDPWRRTSGVHAVRSTRSLAVVRSLWQARDADARRRDISPGRVLPDAAIIAAAQAMPRSVAELVELKPFTGKGTRRRAEQWFAAIEAGRAVPDRELPPLRGPGTSGPPPPRTWRDRDPAAADRLAAARALVGELAETHHLPPENLLQPDLLRRVCWSPPSPLDSTALREALRAGGARPWQVELLAEPLASVLVTLG